MYISAIPTENAGENEINKVILTRYTSTCTLLNVSEKHYVQRSCLQISSEEFQ